jgi:DNA polymerase-3 subunit epsilon
MYLFFDTETTGLADCKMPAEWEGQPRVCQLGAILTDDSGRVKAESNLLIKPDGWAIPAEASAIHGISQEDAENYGLPIKTALAIFSRLVSKSYAVVAHNTRFDLFLLEVECSRLSANLNLPKQYHCTMEESRDILKLPPTKRMTDLGMTKFKNPSLQEAYRHFFGREFEGAHDAMADVRACKDVFFALKKLGATSTTGAAA